MSGFQDKQDYGEAGVEVVTTAALAGGEYCAFLCLTAVTFSAFTSAFLTGTITGISIPAGTLVKMPFTAATVSAGTLMAYKSFKM